jgi:hypothetical protein
MDPEISELESIQGAATSADLSWQEPHMEVIDPSLEERLAAGISMIGLHTKRLSGAQQRNITRERKMREGTWTERKPPRKTPSSDRSVVGRSGGLKRPNSDSNTPTVERQQLKKPRNTSVQNESYKEAAVGIKMVIIHRRHSEVKLDQTRADMIQAKLLAAVDAHPLGDTALISAF